MSYTSRFVRSGDARKCLRSVCKKNISVGNVFCYSKATGPANVYWVLIGFIGLIMGLLGWICSKAHSREHVSVSVSDKNVGFKNSGLTFEFWVPGRYMEVRGDDRQGV